MDAKTRTWRWRVWSATWFSYFGFYFSRKPYSIAKGTLEKELGFSTTDLAAIYVAYLVAYAVGQFLAGAIGNKWGARVSLLIGMLATVICNGALGFTNSVGTFMALMFVNGLAQATGWSGNVGIMAFWTTREERGSVMGFWGTNYQLGGILANMLAAWALGALGLSWSFWAGSIVTLATWAFCLFNLRDRPEDEGLPPFVDSTTGPAAMVADGAGWNFDLVVNVAVIGCFYFCVKFVRYALWSWAPYMLETQFHLKGDEAGYLSTLFDAGGFLGVVASGLISDKVFGGGRALTSFLFIFAMATLCGLTVTFASTNLTLFGISLFLIGFTLFGPDALMSGAGAIDVGSRRTAIVAAAVINGMGSFGPVVQEVVLKDVVKGASPAPVFATLFGSSIGALALLSVLLVRVRMGKAKL